MKNLLILVENKKIEKLFNINTEYYIKGGYRVLYKGSYIDKNYTILEFNIIESGNEQLIYIELCLDINSCMVFKKWKFE